MDQHEALANMKRQAEETRRKHEKQLLDQEYKQAMIRHAWNMYFLEQEVNMMAAFNGIYEPKESPTTSR